MIALWLLQVELTSEHYDLTATVPEGRELLEFLELARGAYAEFFGKSDRRGKVLLTSRKEYRGPRGSAAFYDGKELAGWWDPVWAKPFFAHEGVHQYLDGRKLPPWLSEGIADCFGNHEVRDGKFRICVRAGPIAEMRLPALKGVRNWGGILSMDAKAFLSNASVNYARAWSLCHFLLTFPDEEDRTRAVPNGKRRPLLEKWLAGETPDLSALEPEWREYVRKMDPGKALKVEETAEGVRVTREERGFRIGDIIVAIGDRKIRRAADLRMWLQDEPYARPIKFAVLRDGREIAVEATWPVPTPE
jgi:hypothetical protein